MRWKCNRCNHKWDEAVSANAFVVQCPSCFSAIPRNLAGGAAQSVAAEAPTVPAPVPAAPIAPSAAEATAPRAISFDDLPETAILGGGGGSISDADTLIEPLSIPPTKISGADPSATATVSPFEQTLPAHDPSPAHQPAPARQPAPAVEDSLFEARDTLIVAGGDTTRGDAPVAAAHRPNRQPIHSQDSISAETEAGSLDSAPTKAFSLASAKEVDLTGQTVGGYRVQRMLGAGGMGAVCLARQISLDRDVALKILPGRLAQNPEFLVRFTREALSAAQLCHHNIIQVYDVGSAGDVHFISMEYVRGDTLGNMVRRDGPLRVEDAASFVLQTARGLKYAHDLGIVHRDIKPDNLMVNEHGIVKIADMGLAKMRGVAEQTMRTGDSMPSLLARAKGDLTMVDVAMGTPAYMPPEQARDASSVDHRADQYALGCTLYYLVSGEPPYSGSTAFEIISQHMESPTPAIEEKVKNVPGELAAIVRRMLAKEPDERYPGMEAVIEDLEIVLGVEAEKGPYTPREHHLELLEREQIGYYGVPSLKWRRLAPMAFYALTVLAAVLCVFSKEFGLAGGFLGLMIMTPLASFILGGVQRKTYLFRRVRSVFFGMPLREWLGVTVGAAVAVALLYALGLLLWWAAFALVAAGLAAAYQLVIVRAVERQRAQPLGTIQEMLKHLRLKGLSEDAIQDFICRFSGEHWEEMFESLFGYEAMLEARARVAATDHLVKRKRYGVWREPILRWLDGVEDARRSAREKRHLAKVEARRLKAQGASERDAKRRAKVAAAKMHSELRSEDSRSVKAEARSQKEVLAPKPPRRLTPTDNVFRGARFVLGAVILLFFCSNLFSRIVPAAVQGVMQQVLSLPVPDPLLQMMLTFWGGAVSLLLIISAWSVHRLTGALVTAGAAAVVTANYLHPLVRASGLLDELSQYLQASTAIAGLGLAIAFFHKMAGRKF